MKWSGEAALTGLEGKTMHRVTLPLEEERVRHFGVGDIVFFDGRLFTGRESFYIRAEEEGIFPSLDYNSLNLMVHVGPVMEKRDSHWEPLSLTPTTSIRMEKYAPNFIRRFRTRAIIGKGTMVKETMNAMAETGCVHLCGIGINGNVLARQVKEVVDVYYLDEIGPTEATWVLQVGGLGPFVVDMDAEGNNLFSAVRERSLNRLQEIYCKHGIAPDYEYTSI